MTEYTLSVKRYEPTDERLGRHVRHDSRNRLYAFPDSEAGTPKASIRWGSNLPITDQGAIGACTGFTAVDLLGYNIYWQSLTEEQQAELQADPAAWGLKFYSLATTLDGFGGSYPPDDTGSDGPAAAKALQQFGFTNGYQHAFSIGALDTALATGPVMVGTVWYESMMDTDADGLLTVSKRSGVAGGHEYLCDEWDADRGLYGFRNHWTEGWGLEGRFYIKRSDFMGLLASDGDVTIPVPLSLPAPEPASPVDADVLAAYNSLKKWATKNKVA